MRERITNRQGVAQSGLSSLGWEVSLDLNRRGSFHADLLVGRWRVYLVKLSAQRSPGGLSRTMSRIIELEPCTKTPKIPSPRQIG